MKLINPKSGAVQAPAVEEKKSVKEEPGVGGSAAVEEQARAIVRVAQRALEEEKADGGTKPSPLVRSLQRFLTQRLAAEAVDVQRDGESTS